MFGFIVSLLGERDTVLKAAHLIVWGGDSLGYTNSLFVFVVIRSLIEIQSFLILMERVTYFIFDVFSVVGLKQNYPRVHSINVCQYLDPSFIHSSYDER